MVSKTLLLFTNSYPYDKAAESTFIQPELKVLTSTFEKIFIIPSTTEGKKEEPRSLRCVDTREELARCLHQQSLHRKLQLLQTALCSPLFYRDIRRHPVILRYPNVLKRLLYCVAAAHLTERWICEFIRNERLQLSSCLFYTYWFTHITTGLNLAQKRFPQMKVLSRSHGNDIYLERFVPPYIPLREISLQGIEHLILISEHAKNYMVSHYPNFKDKYEVARLGIDAPKKISQPSTDNILRIVSCSGINPIKRLGLLIQGISILGTLNAEQQFRWHHIGDGPSRRDAQKLAKTLLPSNVNTFLLGQLPNHEVLDFYETNPVDVFINVSASEGIPVSIMEAQSHAIPVIATAVGGNPEIVNPENGVLLSADPSPHEIASALESLLFRPELKQQKAQLSQLNWEKHFNADINSHRFAKYLQSHISE